MNRAHRILIRSALFAGAFIYSASTVFVCPNEPSLNFWAASMGGVMALWPLSYVISLLGRIGRETPKIKSVQWQAGAIMLLIVFAECGRRSHPIPDPCPEVKGRHLGPNVILHQIDCSQENLEGVWLSGSELWNANFRGANLSGASLRHADLSGADLTGADLTAADIGLARFTGAKLGGVNLDGIKDNRIWGEPEVMPDGYLLVEDWMRHGSYAYRIVKR